MMTWPAWEGTESGMRFWDDLTSRDLRSLSAVPTPTAARERGDFLSKVSEWGWSLPGADWGWELLSLVDFVACWDGPKRKSQRFSRLSIKKQPWVSDMV